MVKKRYCRILFKSVVIHDCILILIYKVYICAFKINKLIFADVKEN